ncbi:cytochrome P450 [Ceratobasidium sp. AG-I]|nr:cytochrome P450 [Ceratobasidium sp. AG-I]
MSPSSELAMLHKAALIALGTSSVLYLVTKMRSKNLPLPPSPKGSYLLGHTLVLPTDEEHLTYAKWAKELNSSIISLTALGQTIIVLHSVENVTDLLERRSAIYSDRPQLRVISDPDLLDWSYNTGSIPYGDKWRKQRRMTHNVLKSSENVHHFPLMERETRAMLKRILQTPKEFGQEFRRTISTEIMSTVYGYTVTTSDDYFVRRVEAALDNFSRAALPTNFMVNFIPWLKYVPDWVPGTGWKHTMSEWCKLRDSMVREPYDWTKTQIANGVAAPSMVKKCLEEIENDPSIDRVEAEDRLKWAASTLFGGASDTSASSAMTFVLAMVQNPDIQAKAQAEIDAVTSSERLPEMADRDSMPYLQRIVREVLRWQPVLPLGFPRATTQDDEYMGYRIPKGSIVLSNTWAMTRNETLYEDPESFNPDRFLDPSVPDAPVFGLGRRMCPGNNFAEASLFITFASMLAVFNIEPTVDPISGKKIIPETKVTTNALVSHPLPFDCVIKPRSAAHQELIDGI